MAEKRERERESEFYEQVVWINRVTKVVKGGKNFSFSALVVAGDRAGRVGYAMGKAREVPLAIQKAIARAKLRMIQVPMVGTTIAHHTYGENCGGRVILRPAAPGTGVIAGGPVRAVLEAAGVRDVLTKSLGSSNPTNVVKATFNAISALRDLKKAAKMRGKKLEELELGDYVKQQIREQEKNKYEISADSPSEKSGGIPLQKP